MGSDPFEREANVWKKKKKTREMILWIYFFGREKGRGWMVGSRRLEYINDRL
jgi:hypothetical protein